jgi:hypothetical protein
MLTLPPWLDAEAWLGFSEMRKKIKKPLTDRAERLLMKKLSDIRDMGHDPNDALDQSVVNCWTGVFPVRGDVRSQQPAESFRERDARAAAVRHRELSGGTVDDQRLRGDDLGPEVVDVRNRNARIRSH